MLFGIITGLAAAGSAAICGCAGAFESLAWLWMLPVIFAGLWLAQTAVFFGVLLIALSRVDQEVPQEEDSPFFRTVARLLVPFIKTVLCLRVETQGLEKTPKDGRFMLVCNHLDDSDPVILLHYFRNNQLAFISKRENKDMFIVGKLMHKLQCQLVNRENDREALKTILRCIQLLKDDAHSVAVFPEGYVYDDLKLHRFRNGVFKIAQKANVPIVVCTLRGTPEVLKNMKKLKPSHVELRLLEVISAEEVKASSTVDLGNRIYEMMAADLGPDLVAEEST